MLMPEWGLHGCSKHLVHLALLQEDLEDEQQRAHGRQLGHELAHVRRRHRAVGDVKGDVEVEARGRLLELDDRHLGLGHHLCVQGLTVALGAVMWQLETNDAGRRLLKLDDRHLGLRHHLLEDMACGQCCNQDLRVPTQT